MTWYWIGDYDEYIDAHPWLALLIERFPENTAGYTHRLLWEGDTAEEALFSAMLYATLNGAPPTREAMYKLAMWSQDTGSSDPSGCEKALSPYLERDPRQAKKLADEIWSRWEATGWAQR